MNRPVYPAPAALMLVLDCMDVRVNPMLFHARGVEWCLNALSTGACADHERCGWFDLCELLSFAHASHAFIRE